jgi:Zn-dependent peptidase ImmA (M78 family)
MKHSVADKTTEFMCREDLNIEAKANSILSSTYGDIDKLKLPIDLSKILKESGIKTQEGTFNNPNILGAYYSNDERTILLSDKETYQEKAFTVAHELGHFFLQDDKSQDVFF